MRQERKRDIKKMIKKFKSDTILLSSTTAIYDNNEFKKLEKIVKETKNKERLFKIIKSQLKRNIFLCKLLEDITGQMTVLNKGDEGKVNKVFDFWTAYQY